MNKINYFSPKQAAERYAKGRPDFHQQTIARVRSYLKIGSKVEKALDVACGTGLSTKALLDISKEVFGTDPSNEMLSHALAPEQIRYSLAMAEAQPFPSATFDLITVSSGVHWFEVDSFLREAARLLKPNGALVIYDNFFLAEMENEPEFKQWFNEVYLAKFPSPPRNDAYKWEREKLSLLGFDFEFEDSFKNEVDFTKGQLAMYFTSQSNIISQVEKSMITYEEAESWLNKELEVFYKSDQQIQRMNYGNWIKYLRKSS